MNIIMPKLSDDTEKAVLCSGLKDPGDAFKKGEPIFEIETEKVVSQVEATEDGIMGRQLVEEGDEAAVGAVLAETEQKR